MRLADGITVVSIDQQVVPEHQGITTALSQDAALQRLVLFYGQRVNVRFEFFVDDDVHGQGIRLQ